MMIHSVADLSMLLYQDALPPLEEMETPFGYLQGRRTQEGLMIERIISTDPSIYLDNRYTPGSIYHN